MQNNFKKALIKIDREPSRELLLGIIANITAQEMRRIRARFVLFASATSIFSVIAVIMFGYASQEFAHSEFLQYLSLIFSDTGAVMLSWREFLLSLMESVPLTGATIALIATIVSLNSAKVLLKNINATNVHLHA